MLFPITPKSVPNEVDPDATWNHIELHLFYRRFGGCLDLTIEAVEVRDIGDDFTATCAYGAVRESHTYQLGWRRDSHKKKKRIEGEIMTQMAAKSGYAWDLVAAYCEKHGYRLCRRTIEMQSIRERIDMECN
jgi:hypothetical protein